MTEWYEILTLGDFGWAGQLIPLLVVAGASYAIARKTRDMMIIQFPLTIAAKVFFPFFDGAWVLLSLAIFILNILGSKNDFIAELKSAARIDDITAKVLKGRSLKDSQILREVKAEKAKEKYEDLKQIIRDNWTGK
jgi:hypothetical protein